MARTKKPMLTMSVAHRGAGLTTPGAEVPLDLAVEDVKGQSFVVLRAGPGEVLLSEPEAMALAMAIEKLAPQASVLDSARNFIEGSQDGGRR